MSDEAFANFNFVERIAEYIISVAKQRVDESSDLVAAIHGVLMEVGLFVGKKMDEIRRKERAEVAQWSER